MPDHILIFLFLAFPPTLLILRFVAKRPAWWLVVLLAFLFVLAGWVSIVGTFVADQVHISELIDQGRDEELPEGWDSDGGRGVFAVFFGFLFPLVYLLFWFALYGLAALIRMPFRLKKRNVGQ
jgi:predicted PurR-regulated permease PerM